MWQANHIADRLRASGHTVEIEVIRTTGDRMQPFESAEAHASSEHSGELAAAANGKGIFIKEIEEALAAGTIDLAVHSLKDLPTQIDPRFTLAAIPERADARDVWVCEPYWALHTLPMGGRIGTTSPRRQAQLLALRPDVKFVELRGNIDTRLRKLERGECDALVLAAAGLDRLGRTEWVHQRFAPEELTPAPGQGALALETRATDYTVFAQPERDAHVMRAVAALDHPTTRFAVTIERAALDALGGGCSLPVGVYCAPVFAPGAEHNTLYGNPVSWRVDAQVVAQDGDQVIALTEEFLPGIDPLVFGRQIAGLLEERGALALLV
ncbi:MAG: hypothetical protein NVSMB62_03070 [Acidobacteriaceae bacterium]